MIGVLQHMLDEASSSSHAALAAWGACATAAAIVAGRGVRGLRREADAARAAAREAQGRNLDLEKLVAARTAELAAERAKDEVRMGELEGIVEQRTAELRRRAMHDALTGLPNRTMFFERLQAALRSSQADPSHCFAVLFIDFDHFKAINDTLGHEAGDALLMCIGQRLSSHLRAREAGGPGPMAARLGGDEFCVLLEPLADVDGAAEVARRVLSMLSEPYSIGGRIVQSGASVGVTTSATGYASAEDVLRDADTAMYRAKASGRGNVVMFRPQMHEEEVRRTAIRNDLMRALPRGEMELHYQPIVALATGQVRGAEALLRWNHGQRGRVMPGEFIPLAEETGLIVELGAWAIEGVCRKLARLGRRVEYLTVNVSRRQIADPDFLGRLDDILRRTSVDPRRLVVELTGRTLAEDPGLADRALEGIRSRGARVYLDDFGTGLSSLASFRKFTVDGLKLHRSFLEPSISSRRAAAVIRSGVTLARDLGVEMVAEGIESLDQVALLQSFGCERAQGYLFSQPVSESEFVEMLDEPVLRAA